MVLRQAPVEKSGDENSVHLSVAGAASHAQMDGIFISTLLNRKEGFVHFIQDMVPLPCYHTKVDNSLQKEISMRKVISFMHVSLDGFTAGPNDELEWAIVDEELNPYVDNLFKSVDTALYGRRTYEGMMGYWPTVLADPQAPPRELAHARWVEDVSKIVFSKTLARAEWNNSRLIKDQIAEEIGSLKQQAGLDLMIFGSPRLTHTFMHLGLIDEYRLFLNPIVLGGGIPLFQDIKSWTKLKLLDTRTFQAGVVGLHYQTT
jgi:dihydrofolate reductase